MSLAALSVDGIEAGAAAHVEVGAGIADACDLSGVDHALDVGLISFPVGQEDAGRAGHGHHESVGGQSVLADRVGAVAGCGAAILHVVVLHEGDGIAAIAAVVVVVVDQILVAAQEAPVALVDGITHGIAELEVEGCGGLAGVVDPIGDGAVARPVLAHGEGHVAGRVVVLDVGSGESLHHVVPEARISQVVEQEVLIGLDDLLHIGALVVEVAASAPVLALIVVAEGVAVGVGPGLGLSAVVVGRDVGGSHLVGHALVGLGGIVHPRAVRTEVVAVVDHHIGDDARAFGLEGADHGTKLSLGAKRRVLVEIVDGHVAHHIP